MGVYDFDKGHHYAPNDPHLDGRAMDVDTINGESVTGRASPLAMRFVRDALASDPNLRLGLSGQLYTTFARIDPNRVFEDAGSGPHIHVELSAAAIQQSQHSRAVPSSDLPQATVANSRHPTASTTHLPPAYARQQNAMQAVWNEAANRGGKVVHGVEDTMVYYKDHPLEALDAILGSAQRFVGAAGTAGWLHGANAWGEVQSGTYAALHPRDQQTQQHVIEDTLRLLHLPLNDTGIKRAGEVLLAQTLTDPLNLASGLSIVSKVGKVAKLTDLMAEALEGVSRSHPMIRTTVDALRKINTDAAMESVSKAMKWTRQRPELDPFLNHSAKAGRLGIEHRSYAHIADLADADAALMRENETALRNVHPAEGGGYELPPAVRQRYLREPYVYGTPAMRAEAERLGYLPTDAERARAPQELLDYDLQQDYQTLIRPQRGQTGNNALLHISGGQYSGADRGFELPRSGSTQLGKDQYEITNNRLRLGRELIRRRIVDRDTQDYLERFGGWEGDGPIDVTRLSDAPWAVASPLRNVSRLAREAVMAVPFPHVSNIMQLAWLRGGPIAFGTGLSYALKGLSTEQTQRLVNMGAHADYMRDLVGPWKEIPGTKQLIQASNAVLTRIEGGYRQALLDQLDEQFGHSADATAEFRKGQEIRDAMGDYRNINAFVSVLNGLGGPFLAFRMNIVPRAAFGAIRRRPWNVESLARTIVDVNRQQHASGDEGPQEFHLGGTLEDFERMMTDPFGFVASPSSLGPVAIAGKPLMDLHYGKRPKLLEMGEQAARSYTGPLTNIPLQAFGVPYPQPDHESGQLNLREALMAIFGPYVTRPASAAREQYESTGPGL